MPESVGARLSRALTPAASAESVWTICRPLAGVHVPEAGVQPSRDGMVPGNWVAACAFRWDVRG